MTMLTIIISCVVLLKFGLSAPPECFFVMAMAAWSARAFSLGTDDHGSETGYWLGSTPAQQEKVKYIWRDRRVWWRWCITIVMLARVFQFGEQAAGDTGRCFARAPGVDHESARREFRGPPAVAYILFGVGALVAVMMEMLGVPALTFALGMYLPLELNSPALVGGFLSYLVTKKSEKAGGSRKNRRTKMRERGVIIAFGPHSGGALGARSSARPCACSHGTRKPHQDTVYEHRLRLADGLVVRVPRPLLLSLSNVAPQGRGNEVRSLIMSSPLDTNIANAISDRHAVGGDVMNPSGVGGSSRTPGFRMSRCAGLHHIPRGRREKSATPAASRQRSQIARRSREYLKALE